MKGLDLSREYFYEIILPAFEKYLPDILNFCAFGLAGEGSECFGYDDTISQDHDFGPSVCIWLREKDYNKYVDRINEVLKKLPKEFKGFPALIESEWGLNRRNCIKIEDFCFKFLGQEKTPSTILEWQKIPEVSLATITNGEIFLDNLGEISRIREEVKYYPEVIRQNKIATRCMNISQYGQYNYTRCLRRNDLVAANQALYLFVEEVIHLVALLNKKYRLFYKWMNRSLLDFEHIGKEIHSLLNEMVYSQNKVPYIKRICDSLIFEIKRQDLSKIESDYLEDFGVDIQKNINDEFFRNYSPCLD